MDASIIAKFFVFVLCDFAYAPREREMRLTQGAREYAKVARERAKFVRGLFP